MKEMKEEKNFDWDRNSVVATVMERHSFECLVRFIVLRLS